MSQEDPLPEGVNHPFIGYRVVKRQYQPMLVKEGNTVQVGVDFHSENESLMPLNKKLIIKVTKIDEATKTVTLEGTVYMYEPVEVVEATPA